MHYLLPALEFFFSDNSPLSYVVIWPTNTQLFYKLSYSYMFRHYRDFLRDFVINTLPSYTNISNAACVTWPVIDYKFAEDDAIVSKQVGVW